MSAKDGIAKFSHAECGMTRFPPNVESISIHRDGSWTWLVVRRNDTELRFPLRDEDRAHLAKLLLDESEESRSGPIPLQRDRGH